MVRLRSLVCLLAAIGLSTACGGSGEEGPGNEAPIARFAPIPQSIRVGTPILLDGRDSADAEGATLTYKWTLSVPEGSTATVANPTAAETEFTPDVAGSYSVTLVVNDGKQNSPPALYAFTVKGPNVAPVAELAPDYNATVDTRLAVDGSASADADGDPLTYKWSLIEKPTGSSAVLSGDEKSKTAYFTPDEPGAYRTQLIVSDGIEDSVPDVATIYVGLKGNESPVANAGADQDVGLESLVNLDGSASSDPNGDTLRYEWTLEVPEGSTATLNEQDTATPQFLADKVGTYTARLTVWDEHLPSSDSVTVVVIDDNNQTPTAVAGGDTTGEVGERVQLDGSDSSDPDAGQTLTMNWSFAAKPAGSAAEIIGPALKYPYFEPDVAGQYVVRLVVSDGRRSSAPSELTVDVIQGNDIPVADAGENVYPLVGEQVTLDGSGSLDPENAPLTYSWTFNFKPVGSTVEFDNANVSRPSFTPDVEGIYIAQLIVNDGAFDSEPATVRIEAEMPNRTPVADAGPFVKIVDAQLNADAEFYGQLDGTRSSDPDGDLLGYAWTIVQQPLGSTPDTKSFQASRPKVRPDSGEYGNYVLQLVVTDPSNASSAADTATLKYAASNTAPGSCSVGSGQTVTVGSTAQLTGSATDADGDTLNYRWSVSYDGTGTSTATIVNPYSANASFTPDAVGMYYITLDIDDGHTACSTLFTSVRAN